VRWERQLPALVAVSAVLSTAAAAHGRDDLAFPADSPQTPAVRYAKLDASTCQAELARRKVPFVPAAPTPGVAMPIRLTGGIRGIRFRSALPPAQRTTSPYEVLDCRLAVALDDFAAILERYDVREVIHYSAYRPPPRSLPAGTPVKEHAAGLALDAAKFVRADGSTLDVERDFHGRIGARTCGPGTGPTPATAEAVTLRNIVCEAADAHLFHVILTPDFNWAHRNHMHLEVRAGVSWFLVH
jgi:hypothetical protein